MLFVSFEEELGISASRQGKCMCWTLSAWVSSLRSPSSGLFGVERAFVTAPHASQATAETSPVRTDEPMCLG